MVVLTGLGLGLAVAAALVRSWDKGPSDLHEQAATDFMEAWERSRTGTFVVHSTFHRETARGGELESEAVLVQRPPDHLLRQFGSVEGQIDGRTVGCAPDPGGQTVCQPSGNRTDKAFADQVAEELATFEQYFFEDDHPLYRVTRVDDSCFDLTLARLLRSPPYGNESRFCFDEATGARTFVRIERDEATDVTEAVEVRAQVSDADFQLTD